MSAASAAIKCHAHVGGKPDIADIIPPGVSSLSTVCAVGNLNPNAKATPRARPVLQPAISATTSRTARLGASVISASRISTGSRPAAGGDCIKPDAPHHARVLGFKREAVDQLNQRHLTPGAVRIDKLIAQGEPRIRIYPPEDVGGLSRNADFLEVMTDPRHEEHDRMLDGLGKGSTPMRLRSAALSTTSSALPKSGRQDRADQKQAPRPPDRYRTATAFGGYLLLNAGLLRFEAVECGLSCEGTGFACCLGCFVSLLLTWNLERKKSRGRWDVMHCRYLFFWLREFAADDTCGCLRRGLRGSRLS